MDWLVAAGLVIVTEAVANARHVWRYGLTNARAVTDDEFVVIVSHDISIKEGDRWIAIVSASAGARE